MSRKRRGETNISVGNIENSTGIAIGHGSSASVNQLQPFAEHELISLLDEFIRSLRIHSTSIPDAQDVREAAVAARAEVAKPSPKWHVISGLLTRVAAGVTSVAALTDAINNIQALVARITG